MLISPYYLNYCKLARFHIQLVSLDRNIVGYPNQFYDKSVKGLNFYYYII